MERGRLSCEQNDVDERRLETVNKKNHVIIRICNIICMILWIGEILNVGLMGAWYVAGLMAKASLMMAMPVGLAVYLYCDERYQIVRKDTDE